MIRVFIVLCLWVFCCSCAKEKILDFSSSINIGTDSTLDIVTWNVETFPKHNITIDYVVELIDTMDVDIIALQEIQRESDFNYLISSLSGWAGGFSKDQQVIPARDLFFRVYHNFEFYHFVELAA